MTNIFTKTLTLFGLLVFTSSCDRPKCTNANPVFDKYSPDDKEYKDELIKQLKIVDNSKLTFWLDNYQQIDSIEYLQVFIQGDGLYAKGIVTIKKWNDKLDGIHRTKGMGYRGVELENLKLDIYQDSTKTELIYKDLDKIID